MTTGKPLRVAIADDSTVFRRTLAKIVGESPDINLVGEAADGTEALALVLQQKPDVMVLDIEMPGMDGMQVLGECKKKAVKTRFIMFSSHSAEGTTQTIEALTLGASDYVQKPNGLLTETVAAIRNDLLPKIYALGRLSQSTLSQHAATQSLSDVIKFPLKGILIGVSTGGPDALARMMPLFPAGLRVPLLIVQHMPPIFTQKLAERLAKLCPFPVSEAQSGEALVAGHAYLAPGGKHLTIIDEKPSLRTALTDDAPVLGCKPAVDVLFKSAAEVGRSAFIATVLTGMGTDGTQGCNALRGNGSYIIAQNEASSLIYGMPKAVVERGLAHEILDLTQIPARIQRIVSEMKGGI